MSETATLETPAQAVAEPTPVTTPVVVETPAAPAIPAEEVATEAQAMEAIFEARTTGNNKEADRLTALLTAARNAPAIAEPAAVESAAVVTPVEAETPVVETAEEPETPEAPEKESSRFRFKDPRDRLIAQTAKTLDISLTEASELISRKTAQAAPETPAAEPAQPAPQSASISELEATVAELERQTDALAETGGLYGTEAARLNKELSRANAKLEAARIEASISERENARENGAFETDRAANEAAALKQYPALGDSGSALSQLWYDLCLAAHNPQHPDHAKAQSVDGPAFFAAKAAKILSVQPATAKPTTPVVPAPPAAQPPPATRPAAGNKGSATPPPAKTSADIARDAESEFESATTGNFTTGGRKIGGIITR